MKITLSDNERSVSIHAGKRYIDIPKDALGTLADALVNFDVADVEDNNE